MNFAYLKGHQSEWSEKVNWTETSLTADKQTDGKWHKKIILISTDSDKITEFFVFLNFDIFVAHREAEDINIIVGS